MIGSPVPSACPVHPLDGWMRTVTFGQDHAGFNATLLPTGQDERTLLIWRSGLTHASRPGAELKLLVSQDECVSFGGLRSIYASGEWDTRNFAGGVMGQGRVGLVAARFSGAGATLEFGDSVFLFSDDGGARWAVRTISSPASASVSFHGDIVRWPAAAGGHDETGYAVFSYNFWTKAIDGLYTRDNGESWFWRTDLCVTDGKLASHLTECWTAAVDPGGPWLMVVRPTTSGRQGPAVLFVSHDLVTWDGPRDGGVPLSGNAPALIVEGAEAFLYTVSRRGGKRELPADRGEMRGERLLVARASAAGLVAGTTDFGTQGGWREVGPLPEQAVGYVFPRRIRDRWFAAFNFAETGSVGTGEVKRCWLGLMTPHRPVVVDALSLHAATPHDNLVDNGGFTVWSLGERIGAARPGATLADRWTTRHPADDVVSAERIEAPHPLDGERHWLRKSCAAASGAHATMQTLGPVDLGGGSRVSVSLRARSLVGPGLSGIRLIQDFGVGGADRVTVTLARTTALTDQPLLYTASGALPSVDGKAIGPGAALRLALDECDASRPAAYDLIYGEISLILAHQPAIVRSRPAAATWDACARYRQRFPLRALATGAGARGAALLQASFPRMARIPIARLRAPDGAVIADATVVALSEQDAAFLVGPRAVGELVEAVLDLDAEWSEAPEAAEGWVRDREIHGVAGLPELGLTAPLDALAALALPSSLTEGTGPLSRLRGLVALEGELRALELQRPADLGERRAALSERIAALGASA